MAVLDIMIGSFSLSDLILIAIFLIAILCLIMMLRGNKGKSCDFKRDYVDYFFQDVSSIIDFLKNPSEQLMVGVKSIRYWNESNGYLYIDDYNEYGFQTSSISSDSKSETSYVYQYDSQNQIVSETKTVTAKSNGKVEEYLRICYEYDIKGNLLSSKMYDQKDVLIFSCSFVWNNKDIEEYKILNSKGTVVKQATYQYENGGRFVTKNIADFGKEELRETFVYDDSNLLVDHSIYKKGILTFEYSYKYDENGKKTELKSIWYEQKDINSNEVIPYITEVTLYNEKQEEVTICEYGENGELHGREEMRRQYNEHGDWTKEETLSYSYNQESKEVELQDEKYVSLREIEYY